MPKKKTNQNDPGYSGLGGESGFSKATTVLEPIGVSIAAASKDLGSSASKMARDIQWIQDTLTKLKNALVGSKDEDQKELLRELEEEEQLLQLKLTRSEAVIKYAMAESKLMLLDLADLKEALREVGREFR